MKSKKISIIIPVYNVEKYLERCLNSVINQTYKNLEIILIDDGSSDNSPKICDKFSEQDKRIKVVHKANGGVSSARNKGLEIATGEYIQFVDADDYIEPNCVDTMLTKIQDCDLIICGYFMHSKKVENIKVDVEINKNYKQDSLPFMQIVKSSLFSSLWNKLYKKELIKSEFNNAYFIGEDVIFNLNYLQQCEKVKTITESLYHYNFENNSSIMHTKVRDEETFTNYWTEIYCLCDNYFYDKNYIPVLNGMYIKAAMSQIINTVLKQNLKYREYKQIFDLYRNNQNISKALKNYEGKVFYKNNFFRKITILVFKLKLKWLFYVIVKIYNKTKFGK